MSYHGPGWWSVEPVLRAAELTKRFGDVTTAGAATFHLTSTQVPSPAFCPTALARRRRFGWCSD